MTAENKIHKVEIVEKGKPFSILDPILDERTARSKRSCLIMSLIALFIGLTGQVPNHIPLLGIDLSGAYQTFIILTFIKVITTLLLADFIFLAAPGFAKYLANIATFRKTDYLKDLKYLERLPFLTGITKSYINLFWTYRIIIEILIPIFICLWGISALSQLSMPEIIQQPETCSCASDNTPVGKTEIIRNNPPSAPQQPLP